MSASFLLLRGLAREARHWGRFPDLLRARVPEARVATLDLPGMGTERSRPSPASIPAIVEDVRDRWTALRDADPARPWVLVGVSLGGMVAACWGVSHERDFERMVIANSSASNLGLPHERMRPAAMAGVLRAFAVLDPAERERRILELVSNEPAAREQAAPAWARFAAEAPSTRAAVMRQLFAASTYRAPEALPVPVLVLASRADRFVDPRCSERLATRLGAPIRWHDTAGHDLALDAPDWFAEQIEAARSLPA